jgi:ProP effector
MAVRFHRSSSSTPAAETRHRSGHHRAAPNALTPDELRAALRFYCGNLHYLFTRREGAERVDLNGEPAGTVSRAEAAYPGSTIERRRQKAAKPIAATPVAVTARAPRSSLADLRAAAQRRKAVMS